MEAKREKESDEEEGKDVANAEKKKGRANQLAALDIEEDLFESVSKRAWTDLLLQLYKVKS